MYKRLYILDAQHCKPKRRGGCKTPRAFVERPLLRDGSVGVKSVCMYDCMWNRRLRMCGDPQREWPSRERNRKFRLTRLPTRLFKASQAVSKEVPVSMESRSTVFRHNLSNWRFSFRRSLWGCLLWWWWWLLSWGKCCGVGIRLGLIVSGWIWWECFSRFFLDDFQSRSLWVFFLCCSHRHWS